MEDNIVELIEGEFVHTIYKSDSYMVSRFDAGDEIITVTGLSFDYEKTQKYLLSGTFVDHPKYGRQFSVATIERLLPSNEKEVVSFLSSKAFPGIGKKAAQKIYDHFGDDTLKILKEDPERIHELDLSLKQQISLSEGLQSLDDPENDTLFYLVSNGFNNNDAHKIFDRFKYDCKEIAADNPFRFYNEIYAISFETVKKFASKIDFPDSEIKYKEAFLLYMLNEYTFNTGNIYVSHDELNDHLNYYGGMNDLDDIIQMALSHEYIFVEDDHIYLMQDYSDELFIAHYLNTLQNDFHIDQNKIQEAISDLETEYGITYDEQQKNAIANFLINEFSIITGGPGTGKTTIIKSMAKIFQTYLPYNNLIVVAPTGRAAKRINEICNVESKTIHSLLRWDKENNVFVFNEENPIMYDAIIIDEFSMVDNSLFASLLRASAQVKKICIIGDNDQLPSIRPGDLLDDIVRSGLFPVTALTSNYRQSEGNEIITLANDIIHNDVDLNRFHQDIHFYDPKTRNLSLIDLIDEDLNNGYTLDDIQILTPMYKGEWGIDNLNLIMQDRYNPSGIGKNEKSVGKYLFREGDKILQLKNRPNDDVYNGDIGTLLEINEEEKYFLIDFSGTFVFYGFDDLQDISLAYAMSVHKAQGSEYQIVYFVINRYNLHMLSKKLIYTAISRARMKLDIIGEQTLLLQGLSRILNKRKTTLLRRLENA
ncbi:MAG: AAA family ATPase [Erysipelotrichaceae bacterium]|nr:AAA family ATPase [Erysipelotrichaceae bacterium]